MKKNKKRPQGKHCISLYVDFAKEEAGCFINGSYDALKTLLLAAAYDDLTFSRALLDAALEYAHEIVEEEK